MGNYSWEGGNGEEKRRITGGGSRGERAGEGLVREAGEEEGAGAELLHHALHPPLAPTPCPGHHHSHCPSHSRPDSLADVPKGGGNEPVGTGAWPLAGAAGPGSAAPVSGSSGTGAGGVAGGVRDSMGEPAGLFRAPLASCSAVLVPEGDGRREGGGRGRPGAGRAPRVG